MTDTSETAALLVPDNAVGLRLCKVRDGRLTMCEGVKFAGGAPAVDTVLRRARISGDVGPIGKTGDFWADILDANGDWFETIALSRTAWNSLKNHWMRCKVESSDEQS